MTDAHHRGGAPSPEWLHIQEELVQLQAHDMRNALAAIMANLSFLDHALQSENSEVHETVGDVRQSAEVLLRLVENSVAIARLEASDHREVSRTPVSLAAVASTAVERCASAAMSSAVVLSLQAAEDAQVMGDPMLLELMVQNMVGNAIQHSRRGWTVSVRTEREGGRAAIAVLDEASPFGDLDRHFTREAQPAIKLSRDGRYSRGLGLYAIGLVARAFDGTIVPSRRERGSTLRVWFKAV